MYRSSSYLLSNYNICLKVYSSIEVLFTRVDRAFEFRFNFVAFPPMPVVVAVVVDVFDRECSLRWDVVREIVWSGFDIVFVRFLLEAGLAFFVLSQFFSVAGNVSELLWRVLIEGVADVSGKFC